MIYNEEADAELERLYSSVGAVTDQQKINTLYLALNTKEEDNNWHATGGKLTDEMKKGCLEQEYLCDLQLISILTY